MDMNAFSLQNKIAWVTGGSYSIGFAIAEAFAAAGATIVFNDIRQELVDRLESLSAASGHSRNELIGLLLEYAVENCEVKENPPDA